MVCITASILVVLLFYDFAQWYHQGKVGKVHKKISIIPKNYMWVCSYLDKNSTKNALSDANFYIYRERVDKQQGLALEQRELSQYPEMNHNGKEYEKECIYACITESLCHAADINKTLKVNYILIKNIHFSR